MSEEADPKLMSDNVETERRRAANKVASELNADILLYNGPIHRPVDIFMHQRCRHRKNRAANVALLLITEGGDADAAYRMSRSLQDSYEKFICIIPGYCKSAGTLIAIGAHELVFSGLGELGPLDVQMSKRDELLEMQSGQTVITALSTLQEKAFGAFEQFFLDMQVKSGGRMTLKTATDLAAKLTIGLFSPVYSQIDPMHVGETGRALSIAQQYGYRLNDVAKNLKSSALEMLITGYSNHGFVIDQREAMELFHHVRSTSSAELVLIDALGDMGYRPTPGARRLEFLSDERKTHDDTKPRKKPEESGPRKTAETARRSVKANGRDTGGLSRQM